MGCDVRTSNVEDKNKNVAAVKNTLYILLFSMLNVV